jgi:hypothetical protein
VAVYTEKQMRRAAAKLADCRGETCPNGHTMHRARNAARTVPGDWGIQVLGNGARLWVLLRCSSPACAHEERRFLAL